VSVASEPLFDIVLDVIDERLGCLHIWDWDHTANQRSSEWSYCGRYRSITDPPSPYTDENPICLACWWEVDEWERDEEPYSLHPKRWCTRPECQRTNPRCQVKRRTP
jgi:hypothetical protein